MVNLVPQLKFAQETLAALRQSGIEILVARHYAEIAHYQDIPLEIDWAKYQATEDNGSLRLYTARAGDELVGYVAYLVAPNPHYSSSLQAIQDVLYLRPEFRRGGAGTVLLSYSHVRLRELGVQAVYQHSKVAFPLDRVLEPLGYERIDVIWAKRLDRD